MTYQTLMSPPDVAVDFNAVRDDGTLGVSRRGLTGLEPEVGQRVELRDPEGNYCSGVVIEVRENSLRIALIWQTWAAASDYAEWGRFATRLGALQQVTANPAPQPRQAFAPFQSAAVAQPTRGLEELLSPVA